MNINFTSASFIYRKTNFNIYGVNPTYQTIFPEATNRSPFIIDFESNLYEKCVYLDNNKLYANFYFTSNGRVKDNVEVVSNDEFISITKNGDYFSLSAKENNTTSERFATILCSLNNDTIVFKVFQNKINAEIVFTKKVLFEYEKPYDLYPVGQPIETLIGSPNLEHTFFSLLNKNDHKKEEIKIFCDTFLEKDSYVISSIKKYIIDLDYDGNPIQLETVPDIGSSNSPKYILSNGKIFYKLAKLKNGESVIGYDEGLLDGNQLYINAKYDNQFVFSFNQDGSLTITNYGRCFMEKKAFYIIKLSHKYSDVASATITIKYSD